MGDGVNLFDLAAKISLDASQVDKGLRDLGPKTIALKNQFDKLDARVKTTSTTLNRDLGGALSSVSPRLGALAGAGGLAGAAAAGLALLTAGTVSAGAGAWKLATAAAGAGGDLHDMAQQTNFSVRTLSVLKVETAKFGGEVEALSPSLVIFQKNLQKWAEGNKEADATFKALGVTTRDNEEALKQAFAGLVKVKDATAQTTLAAEAFGTRGGKIMLGVAKEMDGQFDVTTAKLQKWGLVVTEEDAAAADLFSDQLTELELRLSGVARVIGAETLPAFSAFFMSIEASLDANKTQWRDWGETLAKVVLSIEVGIAGLTRTIAGMDARLSPSQMLISLWANLNKSADEIVGAYNKLVNPDFSAPQREGGAGVFRRRIPTTPTDTKKAGRAQPEGVEGWEKALQMMGRVNDDLMEESRRFAERERELAASVSKSIFDQAFAIKALEANTPDWLQRAQEFIRAKTDEGHAWEADTKQIYLNNAARLEQLRILAQGLTRPRIVGSVKELGDVAGFAGGKVDRAQELRDQWDRHQEQMRNLAFNLTGILDNAIYDGFSRGAARGFVSLGESLLSLLQNVFFRRLEEGLANMLSGIGGGGGWLSKLLGIGIGVAGGAVGGKGGGLVGGITGKQFGGMVLAGEPYLVGERGRELFVPSSNGNIIPNERVGGNTFNVTFNVQNAAGPMSRNTQAQMENQLLKVVKRAASRA